MYYYAYFIIIIGVVYFTWTITKNSKTRGLRISPTEAKKRLDNEKGSIFLDVRNHDEYIKSHIPNSLCIPASVLVNEAGRQLPDKSA